MKQVVHIILCLASVKCGYSSLLGKVVPQDKGGSSLSVLYKPDSVTFAPSPGPLPTNEVSSILSLILGFSAPKDIEWRGVLSGNPFNRPKGLVMFAVDGIPEGEDVNFGQSHTFPLTMKDDASTLPEILQLSHHKTLPGYISDVFNGKSQTVSISANEELAASGYSDGQRSKTVYWSDKVNKWLNVDSYQTDGTLSYTKEQILAELRNVLESTGVKYSVKGKKIAIRMKNAEINFDMDVKEDFLLFSELAMIRLIYKKVSANSHLAHDGSTDVYVFGISALKGLRKKYGPHSIQMKTALSVLGAFLPTVTKKFANIYDGSLLVVSLSLKEDTRINNEKNLAKMYGQLKTHLGEQTYESFQRGYPHLHIFRDLEEQAKTTLCKQVHGIVTSFGANMKFICDNTGSSHHLNRRSLLAAENEMDFKLKYNLASKYDESFPVIFNIWFWLLVVLALTVYAISLGMWYMDPGKDSIIYRMTSQRIKTD